MYYKYVIENSFYVDSNYTISLVVLTVDIGAPFLFIIGKKTCYLAEYKAIYLRKIPSIWCVECRKYIASYFIVKRHKCFHPTMKLVSYIFQLHGFTDDFLSQCTYIEYFESSAYHYTSSIMCKKLYF